MTLWGKTNNNNKVNDNHSEAERLQREMRLMDQVVQLVHPRVGFDDVLGFAPRLIVVWSGRREEFPAADFFLHNVCFVISSAVGPSMRGWRLSRNLTEPLTNVSGRRSDPPSRFLTTRRTCAMAAVQVLRTIMYEVLHTDEYM